MNREGLRQTDLEVGMFKNLREMVKRRRDKYTHQALIIVHHKLHLSAKNKMN